MNRIALYDREQFGARYRELRALAGRPNDVIEQPAFKRLLPSLAGLDVVDLGCGAGGMARWALSQGARSVQAFDASSDMLAAAQSLPPDGRLLFQQAFIEEVSLPSASIDLVMSGLAIHYVADFAALALRAANWLRPAGWFVFSVEHPVVTCSDRQWHIADDGSRLHWPVDRYLEEGHRTIEWLGSEMPREHRTIATYINSLVEAGFSISRLVEPGPSSEAIDAWPELVDHRRRPSFLLIAARKASVPGRRRQ